MVISFKAALAEAEEQGHEMKSDLTHDLSSVSRSTCNKCGRAVLRHPGGNVYGSALKEACVP